MTSRAVPSGGPGPARPDSVEATFPEAFEALSSAIREIAELRSEVSRLRASTHLLLLSGRDTALPAAPASRAADAWVSPRARSGASGAAYLAPAPSETAAPEPLPHEDDSFDWAGWIQRLPPVRSPRAPGPAGPVSDVDPVIEGPARHN